jgi:glycine/D-amino acid oxidase-like deaminating enzyme
MNLSYWEQTTWFEDVDYTIVGSGIVGLSCGLRLREKFPAAKILILERGMLPQGASTKNAGFACFGSISEILDDLRSHTVDEVVALVRQRVDGLQLLRATLGDAQLDYQELGGYELFTEADTALFQECVAEIDRINALLLPIFKAPVYSLKEDIFGFEGVASKAIFNAFEGQIDTGKMMQSLLQLAISKGIQILNNATVASYKELDGRVQVTMNNHVFSTQHLCVATNGFARQLEIAEVQPARAQVLVTQPIPNLNIKGTFHLDKGYYYFRNINNRILFGGGRNLDFQAEETTELAQTVLVQEQLEKLLREVILPHTPFEVDTRWSGVMGVGTQKKPIVKSLSGSVHIGVRLGGMGVAIGSSVGRDLANLIHN